MLRLFRKARKAYVVMITLLLLLPVQQSFSQSMDPLNFVNSTTTMSMTMSDMVNMSHCYINDSNSSSQYQDQQADCCSDNVCESTNCSSSASSIALFPEHELINSTVSQQRIITVEQHVITVFSTELFRPPRNI
jgi:hypothetical protein